MTLTSHPFPELSRRQLLAWGLGGLAAAQGCISRDGPNEVVVYAALDREFSEPLLDAFAQQTSLRVLPKFDVESTKTVGLVQAIMAESRRPRCDVFWNNEILHTLRLQEQGLLEEYASPAAPPIPAMYKSPLGAWYGFAARARVLLVNTQLVPVAERPQSVDDLGDPRWRGRTAIAKPLFGTTATHGACLFAHLGSERARQRFRDWKANGVQVLSGNKQVAQAVSAGQVAFGLTDTDDALIELEKGHPVAMVYPDQREDQLGTLFIPNTVCLIRGGPHPEAGKKLIDFLLRPETEMALARGPSAQIPLNPRVKVTSRAQTIPQVKQMPVDFAEAAAHWDEAAQFLRDEFAA